MTSLTVFLAPSGVADGVYAALSDLSAAGLVGPFAWIGPEAEKSVESVVLVEGGRATDVALAALVSSRVTTVLRVCTLVPVPSVSDRGVGQLSIAATTRAAEVLASTTGARQVVRVRILLARSGGIAGDTTSLAIDGWHNIVLSPEDARSPDFGRVQLPPNPSDADAGRYAAPVIAGLTGLWNDVAHTPLDAAPVLPGQVVRLARSFYRKLETGAVEGALRAEVLTQDGTLPLPSDQRSQVIYVNDVGLATATMADSLWRKHSGVLRGPRLPYDAAPPERVGAWQVLKMFFGFLWASIKNAPGAWYRTVAEGVSDSIALGVQRAVFEGAPAAYEVVVRGRTANGEYAGWADIGAASGQLSGALDQTENIHDGGADLSGLWQDYTRAALTLADAGTRTSDLPPIQVGPARAIIGTADDLVPGPASRFTAIPGVIAAAVQSDGVDATDPLGIRDLRQRLSDHERTSDQGLSARAVLTDLNEWERRTSRSFGVAVGSRLAGAFGNCYGEVQQLLERLRNAQQPPEPRDSNMKLARIIQATLVALLLVTALSVYLVVENVVTWWVALIVIVLLFAVWFGSCAVMFIRTQRHMFAMLHQRRSVIGEFEVDKQNLRSALRDLRRLSQAYGQFLSWSRVLGSFLSAPLGPDHFQQTQSLQIDWGLPMSTGVGSAQPSPDDVTNAAGYLRRELFHLGWLSSSWDNLVLSSIPPIPGSRAAGGGAEMSPVWADRGRGTGSSLDRWSTDLFRGAVTSTGAELVWQRAVASLGGSMSELVPRLVGSVKVAGGPVVPLPEFLVNLDRDVQPSGTFDRTMLTDFAVTNSAANVAVDVRSRALTGLGRVCVATQLSDAMPLDALANADTRTDIGWNETTPTWTSEASAPNAAGPGGVTSDRGDVDPFRAPDLGNGFGF
ncbi:hypothetical protein GOEFS_096_00780 [Gordonia effusa NBRC 100432]|uniref:Uncharacterized protein n=1 Tax=Gordonia effusa NBRC 100432 TaxID=1077974 RepID=H0R4A0_9ACTN|nr:hypothetical protein [Gordonia effusa]GAB19901.1 hypothetical protein GOEFS_096_00780 [Gordonia effusa NBRC 100432]